MVNKGVVSKPFLFREEQSSAALGITLLGMTPIMRAFAH